VIAIVKFTERRDEEIEKLESEVFQEKEISHFS